MITRKSTPIRPKNTCAPKALDAWTVECLSANRPAVALSKISSPNGTIWSTPDAGKKPSIVSIKPTTSPNSPVAFALHPAKVLAS